MIRLTSNFLSNYNKKFINDLIGSLVISGLFKLENKNLILTDTINHTIETDIIKVFHTNSDYMTIWEEKREETFVMDRVEIISANINSILKKGHMDSNNLLSQLKEKITLFTINDSIYEKALQYMVENDYIHYDGTNYVKLFY